MSERMSAAQAALELGISKRRVLELINPSNPNASARLKGERIGNAWVITRKDLDRFKDIERRPGRPMENN